MNEWNDSLRGDYLWSNVNFGEAVTEVMTPLTWSVIQFTLDDWVFLPGMATVGVIGGRPYLNISIFATLFYGLGRSRQELLSYMESTLYMRLPPDMEIPRVEVSKLARGELSREAYLANYGHRGPRNSNFQWPARQKIKAGWSVSWSGCSRRLWTLNS